MSCQTIFGQSYKSYICKENVIKFSDVKNSFRYDDILDYARLCYCDSSNIEFYKDSYQKLWNMILNEKEDFKAKATNDQKAGAYFYIGLFQKEGKGTDKNSITAKDNLKRASELNYNLANIVLAKIYNEEGDKQKALDYYRKVIKFKDYQAEAASELGKAYKTGEGAKLDLDSAKYWYNMAGNEKEIENINEKEIPLRLEVKDTKGKNVNDAIFILNGGDPLKNLCASTAQYCFEIPFGEIEKSNVQISEEKHNVQNIPLIIWKEKIKNRETISVTLSPNRRSFGTWLTDPTNEGGRYVSLALKGGWGANKLAFGNNIESGWGNRFNGELDMNMGEKSLTFVGLGFQHNSYPFSKINNTYYENLSYSSAYIALGWKWQIWKVPKAFHFLYVNFQINYGFNFGASYKNYLLDYELKDNKITDSLNFEYLVGLSLMKKGWGGLELNYCIMPSVLNTEYKQTINGIEFKPFANSYPLSHSLLLNLIVFILK